MYVKTILLVFYIPNDEHCPSKKQYFVSSIGTFTCVPETGLSYLKQS